MTHIGLCAVSRDAGRAAGCVCALTWTLPFRIDRALRDLGPEHRAFDTSLPRAARSVCL